MKYFTVLLLGLLGDNSFAHHPKYNDKVNTDILVQSYRISTLCTPVPSGKFDYVITNFKEQYIQSAVNFGQSLMDLSHSWAFETSEELIEAARNRSCDLKRCIKSSQESNVEPTCLEYAVENLNKQFQVFLDLIPGNAHIKRPALPDVPSPPGNIDPISKLSAYDIFVNISSSYNGYLENFYNLAVDLHLSGWEALRPLFHTVQAQYRNEILNDRILPRYRRIVDKVLQFAEYIQCHVRPELWKAFKNACHRIIAISDDYEASKIRKHC